MPYAGVVLTRWCGPLESIPCIFMGLPVSTSVTERLCCMIEWPAYMPRRAAPCRQMRREALPGKSCRCKPAQKRDRRAFKGDRADSEKKGGEGYGPCY